MPNQWKMTLASVLQLSFFAGLALSLVGKAVLPEPQAKFIEQNGMLILGGSFMCSMVAGNLLNTGAFEVSYNGQPVWSKMETGRFPQMEELRSGLMKVMEALPAAAQAAVEAAKVAPAQVAAEADAALDSAAVDVDVIAELRQRLRL